MVIREEIEKKAASSKGERGRPARCATHLAGHLSIVAGTSCPSPSLEHPAPSSATAKEKEIADRSRKQILQPLPNSKSKIQNLNSPSSSSFASLSDLCAFAVNLLLPLPLRCSMFDVGCSMFNNPSFSASLSDLCAFDSVALRPCQQASLILMFANAHIALR